MNTPIIASFNTILPSKLSVIGLTITVALVLNTAMNACCQDPTLDWVQTITGPQPASAFSLVIDNDGKVFETGVYSASILQPFETINGDITLNHFGNSDVYILGRSNTGEIEWVRGFGGNWFDGSESQTAGGDPIVRIGLKILQATDQSLLTLGTTLSDSIDLNPQASDDMVFPNQGNQVFYVRLDTNGVFMNSHLLGGTSFASACLNGFDNLYITGSLTGTGDFDPTTNTLNYSSSGGSDVFLQKLDMNGNLEWVKVFGSTGADRGESVTIDEQENVWITGTFENDFVIDSTIGAIFHNQNQFPESFIAKFSPQGELLWAGHWAGYNVEDIRISVGNQLFVVGGVWGMADADPDTLEIQAVSANSGGVMIQKLNNSGTLIWSEIIEGELSAKSLAISDAEEVIVGGAYSGMIDFDPQAGTTFLPEGQNDVYIAKYNFDGTLLWVAEAAKGSNSSGGSLNELHHLDYWNGYIFHCGEFSDSTDFFPGPSEYWEFAQGGQPSAYTSKIIDSIDVGIYEAEDENLGVIIYPNPSLGKVSIKVLNDAQPYRLLVADCVGRILNTYQFSDREVVFDASFLSSGMYTVIIESDLQVFSKLFVKQ